MITRYANQGLLPHGWLGPSKNSKLEFLAFAAGRRWCLTLQNLVPEAHLREISAVRFEAHFSP